MTNERKQIESEWIKKFETSIEKHAGKGIRDQVTHGHPELLFSDCAQEKVITWTSHAMKCLEKQVSEDICHDILSECSCRYPQTELTQLKNYYQKTGDIRSVHSMLNDKFIRFLKTQLKLEEPEIDVIQENGWGLAGVLKKSTIIATKIPKSHHLSDYLKEKDPERRKSLYCHCPRIRKITETNQTLSSVYCYCGGGFYQTLWEFILGKKVRVTLLKSILNGDDVCSFRLDI